MADPTNNDDELREAVLKKLQRRIDDIDMLQRVHAHLQAGGSRNDDWVRHFLDQVDDDDV